jgi:ketosteroid isomerase-like protein
MKANILVLFLLLFGLGCTSQQNEQLSHQQIDQIKKDVKATADSMMAKYERFDTDESIQYYWDSPDFIKFNVDGSRNDFQAQKKSMGNSANWATAVKVPTVREQFTVLTKDVVICAREGKVEINLKSGDRLTSDPFAYTLVFRNIGGQWKVIHSHESGIIVTEKAGKK